MFCPKVNSECIKKECHAYQVEMNWNKCKCGNVFSLGSRCGKCPPKTPFTHCGTTAICKHYNCKIDNRY